MIKKTLTNEIVALIDKDLTNSEKAFDFDDLVYEALDLEYGNETVGEIIENNNTEQNPYFYSYILALNAPNASLVKGDIYVGDKGEFLPYSWVEKEEFVYDVVTKKVIYKDFFYEKLEPKLAAIFNKEVFKKPINQFSVGLETVERNPEMVKLFLSFQNFEKIKMSKKLKLLQQVENEEVKKEVLNFYNIVLNSGYNI